MTERKDLNIKKSLMRLCVGLKEETGIAHIGATICVHTGPYAIGVGLIKKIQN